MRVLLVILWSALLAAGGMAAGKTSKARKESAVRAAGEKIKDGAVATGKGIEIAAKAAKHTTKRALKRNETEKRGRGKRKSNP
ncbi:MAG: hypothetical protein FJW37_08845 [Acidobacteria bacterium]|nr:hypothetical protein [Acidobacteriota bacterium]